MLNKCVTATFYSQNQGTDSTSDTPAVTLRNVLSGTTRKTRDLLAVPMIGKSFIQKSLKPRKRQWTERNKSKNGKAVKRSLNLFDRIAPMNHLES